MPRSVTKVKGALFAGAEAELLRQILLHRNLSRADLARRLRLAPSTVAIYVERLKAEGFLLESDRVNRKQGRWPTLLNPNPEAGCFVGVDFEASSLMCTVLDFSLQEKHRARESLRAGQSIEEILSKIEAAIRRALKEQGSPLLGIGIGIPGIVDSARGVVSYYKFLPGWRNVPVAQRLAERFGAPVHAENNLRLMAMAELWLGQGRGLRNFACLGVRTGIGMSLVFNGELFCGSQGGAGEIGAWPAMGGKAEEDAPALDTVASLRAICELASDAAGKKMDFPTLRAAVRTGHPDVRPALERAAALHGAALRQVQLLLEPERIIIVGPLAELGSALLAPLTARIGGRFDGAPPVVVASTFGEYGGALGAATLAVHRWKLAR